MKKHHIPLAAALLMGVSYGASYGGAVFPSAPVDRGPWPCPNGHGETHKKYCPKCKARVKPKAQK